MVSYNSFLFLIILYIFISFPIIPYRPFKGMTSLLLINLLDKRVKQRRLLRKASRQLEIPKPRKRRALEHSILGAMWPLQQLRLLIPPLLDPTLRSTKQTCAHGRLIVPKGESKLLEILGFLDFAFFG